MEVLSIKRAYEDVYLDDPEESPDTPHWRVDFSDEAVDGYLAKVGNAIDRAQGIVRKAEAAQTDEERAELRDMLVHLQRRVIVTFVGDEGYEAILEWMGGGERIEPADYTNQLGEVFAAFMLMLGRHATNEQLRACGMYYASENSKTKAFLQEGRKAKGKKRK